VVSSSSRTANLTWDHPFDGRSEITSFLIQYKKHYREHRMSSLPSLFYQNPSF
jgi:hypothetical protein